MTLPLERIRIIDWTIYQMGPVSTAMLADLGAEVIHIENRATGDAGRGNIRPPDLPNGRVAFFECNNRGKQSITLDLQKEKAREVVYRLVAKSDVFVQNMRQGVAERLKVDYDTLRGYNDKLIYASASGYGPKGPEAREPVFDFLGLARSGIMYKAGEPDMPPLQIRGGIGDQMGAIMMSYGILTALLARERFGFGQRVDVSHLMSMMTLQGLNVGLWLYLGHNQERRKRTEGSALSNHYPCKDGTWLMLAMVQQHRYWPVICKVLGIEHLEKDPRFETADKRMENAEELVNILDGIFIKHTAKEWVNILKEAGDIVCTPVQTIADLENDPQVLANDYIVNCNHNVLGPVKVLGLPVQLSKTPGVIKCEAPECGEHTDKVLLEIGGYSREEIAQLREEEVI